MYLFTIYMYSMLLNATSIPIITGTPTFYSQFFVDDSGLRRPSPFPKPGVMRVLRFYSGVTSTKVPRSSSCGRFGHDINNDIFKGIPLV